ncbi:hypothetical protein BDY19DRAFT_928976 [Irpex rosettiformis]|uniref:Uncharacterized protein n=1 Tax=Irpex rosettiformis TaxID=378272 RepID=A0ACB8UDB7_9APHY|nr:hypothetical protein BDY19DRAFT_928976 [Irpex rosettiformis]
MAHSSKEFITETQYVVVWNLTACAVASLITFEHLLTFSDEIRTIWHRRLSLVSVLLLANRYVTLGFVFSNLATVTQSPNYETCSTAIIINEVCFFVLAIIFGLFAALRVYATWNCSRLLFIIISAIGAVPVATNAYYFAYLRMKPIPGVGCIPASSLPRTVLSKYVLGKATRISAILIDLIVLGLTWMKLSHNWYGRHSRGHNLGIILLRNGFLYFFTLLLLNCAEIVVVQLTEQEYVTAFITAITSILVSRFIMNLRGMRPETTPSMSTLPISKWGTQTATVSGMSSFISEIGQDLSHGFPLEDAEDTSYGLIED